MYCKCSLTKQKLQHFVHEVNNFTGLAGAGAGVATGACTAGATGGCTTGACMAGAGAIGACTGG